MDETKWERREKKYGKAKKHAMASVQGRSLRHIVNAMQKRAEDIKTRKDEASGRA